MYIFQVHHFIRPDQIEVYKTATLENARKSRLEPGILRFEIFQDATNPAHFSLFEVYASLAARDLHLETEHFLKWKEVCLAAQDHRGSGDEFIPIYPEAAEWAKAS